jgi:threonine aldolase
VAALLGKEAALFLPGGTMCNLIAVKVQTQPGDVLLADQMAHILRAESGGPAFSSGVQVEAITSARGIFTPATLEAALERLATTAAPYGPQPTLLCVEQTHNFGGGAIWSLAELQAVSALARARGLALHMDGARLMNAVVASGTPAAAFAACVDSVWLDFTKGLGAPLGAVLAGTSAFIVEARRYKHLFGGALRQAGIVAAGCLYALDHHVERLADDHRRAGVLAAGLGTIPGVRVRTATPESNMVFFDLSVLGISTAAALAQLQEHRVKLGAVGSTLRAVTHLDISDTDITHTLQAVAAIAADASVSLRSL